MISSAPTNSISEAQVVKLRKLTNSIAALPAGFGNGFLRRYSVRRLWRRKRLGLGLRLTCSGPVDLLLQEVVEQRSDRRDGGQLSNLVPGWRNGGAQDIRTKLKL